jgi:gliding motility-associated-like protein
MSCASILFSLCLCMFSFNPVAASEIIENKGQWPNHVIGAVYLSQGVLFIETGGHTIHLHQVVDHSLRNDRGHVIKTQIDNANAFPSFHWINKKKPVFHYHQKTATFSCNSFGELIIANILPNIDQHWIVDGNTVKYEWHIQPGGDPALLRMLFAGEDSLRVVNTSLEISTSLGEIREQPPLSWIETNEGKKRVSCEYAVYGNTVTYHLPELYNTQQTLIIDPELVFSTFSGSFSNNFGYTATYDQGGNLYSGSSAFGQNYPITTGAYQTTHQGGSSSIEEGIDMAISKYSADGTTLIWSSFLGGSGDDLPLSMIVNQQMQLCVYGVTGSADFPVTAGAYDAQFSGGSASSLSGTGASFPNGSDIVVCKFSEDGSQLLASTYFGGNNNDGLNTASALRYNYADEFRGEINLSSDDEILIVSSTFSNDFNFSNGAQTFPSGAQDIVIASFPSDLTSLNWASYAGGSGDDSGFSITENFDGSYYITGGTNSTDFNGINGYQPNFGGGAADGYILRISHDGSTFTAGTFFGGADYDQFYFVSRDSDGNICVFGQTESTENIWIQNAGYSVASSGNGLVKFDPSLQTVIWSTLIGTGDNKPNLSPAAFMADLCNRIYICGWGVGPDGGGQLNPSSHLASMQNLATTSGCFDNTSISGDFYMAVFDGNMSSLQYGSFIGGDLSSEHVDGGTSRFDRSGVIYQSICAGCGGNSDFPIYPGNAWSASNNSSCNNAVLKFDFQIPMTVASFTPEGPYCAGQTVNFQQQSLQASDFLWHFGDGSSSSETQPQHVYANPGIYEVSLVVSNSQTCNLEDSVSVYIEVNETSALPDINYDVCHGDEIAVGPVNSPFNTTYLWLPDNGLSNSNSSNPICLVDSVQQYVLYSATQGCADTSVYSLHITTVDLHLISDTLICAGDSVSIAPEFFPQEALIEWSLSDDFSNILSQQGNTLHVQADSILIYFAQVESNGCRDTASVAVVATDLFISLQDTYKFCEGDTVNITNNNPLDDAIYSWQSNLEMIEILPSEVSLWVSDTGYVILDMQWENCLTSDTAKVILSDLANISFALSQTESIIAAGESVQLEITPTNYNYQWQPTNFLDAPDEAIVISTPTESITYQIIISDGNCTSQKSAFIEVIQPLCAPPQIFVPNTFSPNHDGINDKLFVRANEPEKLLLRIYNRWGELVFESRSLTIGWDGTFKGEPVDTDVFTYYLEITCKGGSEYLHEGNITLTR